MQEPTQLYGIKNIDIVNTIGEMKSFTKNNFNLCTDEFLTILKNICDRKVILMIKKHRCMGPDGKELIFVNYP